MQLRATFDWEIANSAGHEPMIAIKNRHKGKIKV